MISQKILNGFFLLLLISLGLVFYACEQRRDEKQSLLVARQEEKIAALEQRISAQDDINKEIRATYSKIIKSFEFIASGFDTTSAVPNVFSFFAGDDWKKQIDQYALGKMQTTFNMINDTNNKYTFLTDDAGKFFIDSVFIRGIDTYKLDNKVPNNIFVMAPGLSLTDKDTSIIGDKIDRVVLDGCLLWHPLADDNEFVVWQASDDTQTKRNVKINKIVPVTVSQVCDNRYLFQRELMDLPQKLSAALPAGAVLPSGRIGLALAEGNGSIFAKKVIPGSPADKAGFDSGDEILQVDDMPTVGKALAEVIEKIVGAPETSVKISFKKYETGEVQNVTVMRQELALMPDNKNQKK